MSKPRYLISNLVYQETYARLFLTNHLNSLLDPTNLPVIVKDYDVEYLVLTDKATLRLLESHPNMIALSKLLTANGGKVSSLFIDWADQRQNKYGQRYSLLIALFHESVKRALADSALLTTWVADLVVAKEFFPRILKRMESGHDAVFVLPARSSAEPMSARLPKTGALTDRELFAFCLECLHPLWESCHWRSPRFSNQPFCLIWNTVGGLLTRTFSTTPIVFKPNEKMLESRGMIDGDIPQFLTNPYWATNWTDAPVIGVEPIVCYAPTGKNGPSTVGYLEEFVANIHPSQKPFLKRRCYYPDEKTVSAGAEMLAESDEAVNAILGEPSATNNSESA